MNAYNPTCQAHYADDPNPCSGPATITVMLNRTQATIGCEQHATDRLASTPGSWPIPLPDAPADAAVRVFKAARS